MSENTSDCIDRIERPWLSRCPSTLRRNGDDHVHTCYRHNGHDVHATIDEPQSPFHTCCHVVREGTYFDEEIGLTNDDWVYCDLSWGDDGTPFRIVL